MRIATDQELRALLIDRGRRQAYFFSNSSQMAEEYWTIFENVIANIRTEVSLQGIHDDGWNACARSLPAFGGDGPFIRGIDGAVLVAAARIGCPEIR